MATELQKITQEDREVEPSVYIITHLLLLVDVLTTVKHNTWMLESTQDCRISYVKDATKCERQ